MKILVINCGSSSLKYQLIDMTTETALASGLIERLGEPQGMLTHKNHPDTDSETHTVREQPIADHEAGLRLAQSVMADSETGVLNDAADIQAVGHRVVHGGEAFKSSTRIDAEAMAAIDQPRSASPLW